jgi:hypothetical protein
MQMDTELKYNRPKECNERCPHEPTVWQDIHGQRYEATGSALGRKVLSCKMYTYLTTISIQA